MFALIFRNKIIQIESEKFEVAPELEWIDISTDSDVKVGYGYSNGQFTQPADDFPY